MTVNLTVKIPSEIVYKIWAYGFFSRRYRAKLRAQNVSLGRFSQEAGLGNEGEYSKRLYRVTLPPEVDVGKRELRAVAKTYARLVAAIAKRSRESVTVVAERVLMGTSLHPMESAALDELTQIQILLQGMVDRVDEEFGLSKITGSDPVISPCSSFWRSSSVCWTSSRWSSLRVSSDVMVS